MDSTAHDGPTASSAGLCVGSFRGTDIIRITGAVVDWLG